MVLIFLFCLMLLFLCERSSVYVRSVLLGASVLSAVMALLEYFNLFTSSVLVDWVFELKSLF